jgi:sugar transferase EpsL
MANLRDNLLKRVFDLVGALLLLLVFSPVFVIVAIFIRLKLGHPIFFRQDRPGKNGRPFRMLKFRTMLNAAGNTGEPLPDSLRLTGFGRALRSTSLDELPELLNVIRGEMSLVGPRPLLMEYLPLYSPEQSRRHEVRPGITGWAQVNGRNSLSWDEKFELDVWYVSHRSFVLDIKILWSTVLKVLKRDGISADGDATMPPFTGAQG